MSIEEKESNKAKRIVQRDAERMEWIERVAQQERAELEIGQFTKKFIISGHGSHRIYRPGEVPPIFDVPEHAYIISTTPNGEIAYINDNIIEMLEHEFHRNDFFNNDGKGHTKTREAISLLNRINIMHSNFPTHYDFFEYTPTQQMSNVLLSGQHAGSIGKPMGCWEVEHSDNMLITFNDTPMSLQSVIMNILARYPSIDCHFLVFSCKGNDRLRMIDNAIIHNVMPIIRSNIEEIRDILNNAHQDQKIDILDDLLLIERSKLPLHVRHLFTEQACRSVARALETFGPDDPITFNKLRYALLILPSGNPDIASENTPRVPHKRTISAHTIVRGNIFTKQIIMSYLSEYFRRNQDEPINIILNKMRSRTLINKFLSDLKLDYMFPLNDVMLSCVYKTEEKMPFSEVSCRFCRNKLHSSREEKECIHDRCIRDLDLMHRQAEQDIGTVRENIEWVADFLACISSKLTPKVMDNINKNSGKRLGGFKSRSNRNKNKRTNINRRTR